MDKDTISKVMDALLDLRTDRVTAHKVDEHGHPSEIRGIDMCLKRIRRLVNE